MHMFRVRNGFSISQGLWYWHLLIHLTNIYQAPTMCLAQFRLLETGAQDNVSPGGIYSRIGGTHSEQRNYIQEEHNVW